MFLKKNFDTVLINPETKPDEILSLEFSGLLISNGQETQGL